MNSSPPITAGIDAGSRTVKLALHDGERVIHSDLRDGSHDLRGLVKEMLEGRPVDALVATGYGRSLLELELDVPSVTEIKAFATGSGVEFPGARTVLDIGGQDTKIIRIGAHEKVVKFEMNDRCAAGTGRFLEVMAKTLGYTLEEFSRLPEAENGLLRINSLCTVFAESEVTTLIARGEDRADIARALVSSLVQRIAPRVLQHHGEGPIIFCGGGALNGLLRSCLERHLRRSVELPRNPQLTGAIGASLLARRALTR